MIYSAEHTIEGVNYMVKASPVKRTLFELHGTSLEKKRFGETVGALVKATPFSQD